jgi:tripartite ATP-independent transporter DctM subunit
MSIAAAAGPSEVKRLAARFTAAEDALAVALLTAMSVLPVLELIARQFGLPAIPGSTVFVQHLTLWVAFVGSMVAARSDRLLALSANTLLPARWLPWLRVFTATVAAAVALALAWASLQFVLAEREGGTILALGIGKWVAEAIMPVGFLAIALSAVWRASPSMRLRALAAAGLLVPLALELTGPAGGALVWPLVGTILAAALLGLPIFATLGGIAVVLFWNGAVPIAAVPVETYRQVASPVLPSIPLFTFAGYLLAEGGASGRLLRVYSTLLGWLPGGLAVTTAVACAVFTWAGSGVTILSLGGLLLPMLVKAKYPERFSIGLINASGSLGLLFPPSVPVILYGIYAQVPIDSMFIGGFLPGLMMVAMVSAYGVWQAKRSGVERERFSWAEARRAFWVAKWEVALPVIVLVGLFGGFGTLVEAGAITVVYSILTEVFIYRGLSLRRDYPRVTVECAVVIGAVLLVIGVAMGFTNYLVDAQVPGLLIAWVQAHVHSKYVFLLLLNVFLLVKGSFMDVFSAIIVMVPLLKPLAANFGIDPVQLGIIFLANGELGYLTPPVGMNLCFSAVRFKQTMTSVYRSTLPFYLILLVGVLLITYVPWFTTWPLELLGK